MWLESMEKVLDELFEMIFGYNFDLQRQSVFQKKSLEFEKVLLFRDNF